MASPVPVSGGERDMSLLAVGAQCAHPSCSLVDFLPLKCSFCAHSFCAEHFKPTAHPCPSCDASQADRIVPLCPVCSTPVPVPPGEDPNIRMDRHLNEVCTGRRGDGAGKKSKTVPVCARPKCEKALYAPIKCSSCQREFCPSHRFPADHHCKGLSTSTPSSSSASLHQSNAPSHPRAAAAYAAVKRAVASTSMAGSIATGVKPAYLLPPISQPSPQAPPTPPSPTKASGSSSPSKPPPAKSRAGLPLVSKADRRARDERRSKEKALQARAAKGLLSAEEKAQLAQMEAEEDKDGCVLM